MQAQLERAAIGGVRATESYGFRPVHKASRKCLQEAPWCVVPDQYILAEARLLQPKQHELLLWELSNAVQECLECFSQQVLQRSFSRK